MKSWFRKGEEAVAPGEVRAIREAAGWTQERVAEEMGVLPVEVSAWESGAVAVDGHQAAVIRWCIDHAEYEAGLPRSACYWTRANEARLERMRERGPLTAGRVEREVAAHARECVECMRAETLRHGMPPPPEPPEEPGLRGSLRALRSRIRRLPAWLRLPLQTVEMAVRMGAAYLVYRLVIRIQGDDTPGLSLTGAIVIGVGIVWAGALGRRLLPLSDRRPYVAGQLFAAGIALPALLAAGLLGGWNLASAGPWIFAALMSVFVGAVAGKSVAEAEPEEGSEDALTWETDPRDSEEERVVVVPQQAHYFRP